MRNRTNPLTGEPLKNEKARKKNNRRMLFVVGGVAALGIGAYFGTRSSLKSLTSINKTLQDSAEVLKDIASYNHFQETLRQQHKAAISAALESELPFQYFPGVGVHSWEMDKILNKVGNEVVAKKTKKK